MSFFDELYVVAYQTDHQDEQNKDLMMILLCNKHMSRVEGSSENINFLGKFYYVSAWET